MAQMRTYTVNQVAHMANVSVRTLHHYDEIGLLKPSFTGENRYRYYGEKELLRLQQILIHRELEIPLAEIGLILDAPGYDQLQALQKQRERLEEKAERYARMIRTIDRTIARLKGTRNVKDTELYSGIVSPDKQAEYEAWLVDRYGLDIRPAIDRSRWTDATDAQRASVMKELQAIERDLDNAMRDGIPSQAEALDPLIERHWAWVSSSWGKDCTPRAYAGLADVYEHPDFIARYEAIESGFADYLTIAMRSWARRQG